MPEPLQFKWEPFPTFVAVVVWSDLSTQSHIDKENPLAHIDQPSSWFSPSITELQLQHESTPVIKKK